MQNADAVVESHSSGNGRQKTMELRLLVILLEQLSESARKLESSMGAADHRDWFLLYREVYENFLIVEKAIYKRKIFLSLRRLHLIKNRILVLFDKYNALSNIMSEGERKTNLGAKPEAEQLTTTETLPYKGDMSRELEQTRERVKKLLDSIEQRGNQ